MPRRKRRSPTRRQIAKLTEDIRRNWTRSEHLRRCQHVPILMLQPVAIDSFGLPDAAADWRLLV